MESGTPGQRRRILGQIFLSTLYLSTFTFGGGYVIVTLMKDKFVDQLHWIEEEEMLDLVAIAQSSPGAVAVNGAIVVGYQLGGIPGVICAVLGAILPPFLILSLISLFYNAFRTNTIVAAMLTGMRSGVGAVIAVTVFSMGKKVMKEKSLLLNGIMLAAFLANAVFHVNVIFVIVACAALGVLRAILEKRQRRGEPL